MLPRKKEKICPCGQTQWLCMYMCMHVFMHVSVCVFSYDETLISYYIPTFQKAIIPVGDGGGGWVRWGGNDQGGNVALIGPGNPLYSRSSYSHFFRGVGVEGVEGGSTTP